MGTRSIGAYAFPPADQLENYGGDINLYCCWEHHLLVPMAAAYRLPPDITLRAFLDEMFGPDHNHHPEWPLVDYTKLRWKHDSKPWQPELDKTLRENGVTHMSYLSFYQPGLDGINGVGV